MVRRPKPKESNGGTPRWSYVVGSIVAVAGLVWAIISYFVPKPEPLKPSPVPTPQSVNVSGNGSIGVGTMTGGKISNVASAPPEKAPPAKRTDKQP